MNNVCEESGALLTLPGKSANVRARPPARMAWLAVVFGCLLLGTIGYCAWKPIWKQRQISLARESLRQFDPKAAEKRLAGLLGVDPHCAEAEFLLAAAYRSDGQLDEVEPHLARAAELGWNPDEIDRQQTLMYFQAGNFRNSGEAVKELLVTPANDDEAEECYDVVVRGYIAALLLEQARFIIDGWISWRPHSVRAHSYLAELASLKGDEEGEFAVYREIVGFAPDDFQSRLSLARALMLKHEVDEAYSLFMACLRDRPHDPDALHGLAEWHLRHGQPEEAKRLVELLLDCEPDARQRSEALTLLGQIVLLEKDYASAERVFRQAVDADPSSAATLYALVQVLSRRGQEEEAQKYLARWKRLREIEDELENLHPEILSYPENPDLRAKIGGLLLEQGQTRAGVNWLLSVLFYDSSHAETNRLLADHYEREGKLDFARRHRAVAEGTLAPPTFMKPVRAGSSPDRIAIDEAAE